MKEEKSLIAFQFENKPVRIITDESGKHWWVAADVCQILGLTNPSEAMKMLDEDEKNTLRLTEGIPSRGNPYVNCIDESGIYTLIIRSDKPQSRPFRKWITSEVLPAIRRTGSYVSGGSVVTLAMKLNIFLNDVVVAGYCSQATLKEYCWLRTLGLTQGMAGAACNIRTISQLQAIDRRLKRIGVTFPNLQYATRRKMMDANFEKLFSGANLAAIDRIVQAEVADEQ